MLDLEIGILLDYYDSFLTDKQRDVMHLYYDDDYSLAEIAEELGVSRQAVHNSIKTARKTLGECEERLGLAARFSGTDNAAKRIRAISGELIDLLNSSDGAPADREKLLSGLTEIKTIISDIE